MDRSKTLRDELIGTETVNMHSGNHYRDNIQKMLDKKLSRSSRFIYTLICIISVLVTLYFGKWVFVKTYGAVLPAVIMRLMCGVGMFFSGILAVFSGWSALTGSVKGRFYPGFIFSSSVIVLCYFWIALFYMMFILPIMMELSNSSETPFFYTSAMGVQLMLLGFFAMVVVGFIFLFRMLSDLKFKNQKKLLEIEYKLCELSEKNESKQGNV